LANAAITTTRGTKKVRSSLYALAQQLEKPKKNTKIARSG
jgi:hypothetical protein